MTKDKIGHVTKLPIGAITEYVDVEPQEPCTDIEVISVLQDLASAIDNGNYIPETPTVDNPPLSDDYVFDIEDEIFILKDLTKWNFVGKIKDIGKGAKRRLTQGLPQEYLYVFKYPCELERRDAETSGTQSESVLIYIKINDRKVPYQRVFIVSFHKNRPKR